MDTRFLLLLLVIAAVWLPRLVLSTTNSTDLSAVVDMFNNLKNTGPLQKWRSQGGADPCGEQWVGIVCIQNSITEINLSKLGLSGSLGYSLQKLVSLEVLDLSDNNLTGKPPPNLPPNLRKLNFARSGLLGGDLGSLYSIRDLSSLTYLNFARTQLTGNLISDIFRRLVNLTFLDLSFNNFTGKIPDTFSSLSKLTTLYLQSNMLTGELNVLNSLSMLVDVNVANNQFMGSIPAILSRLPASNYEGNNLTVAPSGTQQPGQNSPSTSTASNTNNGGNGANEASLSPGSVIGIVFSAVVATAAFTALILFFRGKKEVGMNDEEKHDLSMASLVEKDKQTHPGGLLKPPPVEWFKADSGKKSGRRTNKSAIVATQFSFGELQVSTNNFNQDNLVGEGALGRVYKADMSNGKVVAVKKVDSSVFASLQKEEDFTDIVSNVSRLRHSNIAELIGYCTEKGQRVLVYDYFHKGSLHDFLHDTDRDLKGELSWNVRVKIALGTARAIEYLHEVCMPAIVHKNIKAANLLLDEDLNPHVADCGIAAFSPSLDPQVSTQMLGSLGYSAPEYAMSGIYTVKSDVYSFGVVMLELLTGRKPVDSSRPRAEQSLVRWATPQLHDIDALANMIDPTLNGNYPAKSLSRFADIIALCVQPEPEFRPPMSEVVQSLVVLVQRATVGNRRTGEDQRDSDPSDF